MRQIQPTQYGKDQDGRPRRNRPTTTTIRCREDIDEFRNRDGAAHYLASSATRKGYWRTCKEPVCRRHRACAAPHIHCSNVPQHPPGTPQQRARGLARVQRMFREGLARREQGE